MKSRIITLANKETLQIIRDPRSFFLALGLPIILLILFGYAITFDINHIPIAVVDQDSSVTSRDLVSRINASPYFNLDYLLKNGKQVGKLLDEGKAKIILTIPSGFSRDLDSGKEAPLQLLVDGSDNNTAQVALGYASGIIQLYSAQLIFHRLKARKPGLADFIPPVDVQTRVWFNPDLRSTNFIIPGIIAVVMMVLAAMMTSLTVAREWETGTMEQLISTPARSHEIIIGKLIPYFVLGLSQALLVILVGRFLFHVPLKGSLITLSFVTGLFLICALGIGLLISTITRSQQLAFMMSIILTLLPSFLLSGFIFPVDSMPRIIQLVSYLVPAKYFLAILRGIFLKGTGMMTLWPDVTSLLIFAFIITVASARRLKLSLE